MVDKQGQRPKKPDEVEKNLNEQEERELAEGQALYEMEKNNPGWQMIKRWLTDADYHSWVDPRTTKNKKEWMWQERNAFHSFNKEKNMPFTSQAQAGFMGAIAGGKKKVKGLSRAKAKEFLRGVKVNRLPRKAKKKKR